MKKNSWSLFSVCQQSIEIMRFCTLLIMTQLGYIAFDIASSPGIRTLLMYRAAFEIIGAEIVLSVVGSFLVDLVVKDSEQSI